MTSPSIELFTASDGYRLHWRKYLPSGTPRAQVLGIHGIQSHGGWYEASCRHLAEAGYQVAFLDRRGSGLNQEGRGDCPSFHRLLLDLVELTRSLPDRPFLYAISWGGKLAFALELFHPGLIRGMILAAPGMKPKVAPPFLTRARIGLARLFSPGALFPIPLDDPALFTANPARQQYIRDDPLALRQATSRFLVESVRLDWALRRAAQAVRCPVLLLLAGEDRIIDNAATRAYVSSTSSPDKVTLEFPGMHHTLEFEPGPAPFFEALTRWLDVRVGRGQEKG
jgi:alpha-beta hydrolase superfamily lysophospholipase